MKFYRDITLGYYMPTGSKIHRIEASAKIIELMALIITIFLVRGTIALTITFFFSMLVVKQSKLPLMYVLRGIRPFLWLFLFIFFVHFLVVPGRPVFPLRIGFIKMTYSGLREGILVSSQVALSIIFSSILTLTTSPMELAKGVFRLLSPLRVFRVPVDDIAIIVMISMRYVPLFLREIERITKAQRARGIDFDEGSLLRRGKMALPLLVPLMANSLRKAHGIGDALAVRGYGEGARWPTRGREGLGREGFLSLMATGGVIGLLVFFGFLEGSF
jgi:energy-coupling factor transport system permease protein